MVARRSASLPPPRERAPLSPLVRWLLVGPVIGFFLNQAVLNFRAERPMLGGLHAIALITWVGLLLILDFRFV